jgi:hypothetical protein
MITPSPSKDKGHARRLLVTLVITTAAAAVTAGVALKRHPPAEAAVQRAEATAVMPGGTAPTVAPAGMTASDPSLPAVTDALKAGADASGEPASTF